MNNNPSTRTSCFSFASGDFMWAGLTQPIKKHSWSLRFSVQSMTSYLATLCSRDPSLNKHGRSQDPTVSVPGRWSTKLVLPSGKETALLALLTVNHSLLSIKVHLVLPCSKENILLVICLCQSINQLNPIVSPVLCGPSNNTVLQQRLKVLVAGGGRALLVTAGEGCVDVDASQRGHRLFAVWEGLVVEGELGGRGRAGGFLWNKESNEEGDDHGARTQKEGWARDECSLRKTEKDIWGWGSRKTAALNMLKGINV